MWCHHGWMPPAMPSIIHIRASAAGLRGNAEGSSGPPDTSPCSPASACPTRAARGPASRCRRSAGSPSASLRDWWSSSMNSARLQISAKSRKERAWVVIDPLFIPIHRQSGPPAALVVAVVQVPDCGPPRVAPLDPLPVDRVVPVGLAADGSRLPRNLRLQLSQ